MADIFTCIFTLFSLFYFISFYKLVLFTYILPFYCKKIKELVAGALDGGKKETKDGANISTITFALFHFMHWGPSIKYVTFKGGVRGVAVCDRGPRSYDITLLKICSYIRNLKLKVIFSFLL